MNIKRTLMMTSLLAGFSHAHANDLTQMVKINEGHYATFGDDGRVIELATNAHMMQQFDQELTDAYVADTKVAIESATKSGSFSDAYLCGYRADQDIINQGPVIANGNITLDGRARVWFQPGPFPPSPNFAYTRVKSKLKSFFADGTLAERDYQIDRDPSANANAIFTTDSTNQVLANYSSSFAQAQVSLAGVDRFTWVVRSEFIVDNPVSDDGSVPQDQDCYNAFSVREFNSVDL
ncbi:hypothetical protein OS175_04665 [Marinicella sp. S1101]|uniref:hypothetical protein n=1 Tax=Marinicella marina TaxID=2996016 RepID=UPI002260CD34|nr:hypothetical protein [Marinicella marina]MCX7553160.1 hypothetical protein [Marinicella marina]MDJ1138892.1 hypothetical protein [Marinicella marina]